MPLPNNVVYLSLYYATLSFIKPVLTVQYLLFSMGIRSGCSYANQDHISGHISAYSSVLSAVFHRLLFVSYIELYQHTFLLPPTPRPFYRASPPR